VEVMSTPFASRADAEMLGLPPEDMRRPAVEVANPLSEDEPLLRTTLLPGLFRVAGRNAGRGFADLALFEIGAAALARPDGPEPVSRVAPILPVDRRPGPEQIAELESALPEQPTLLAIVLTGEREPSGWWGAGRPASFRDAIEAAQLVLRTSRLPCTVRAGSREPWHPGRCAEFVIEPPPVDGADGPVTEAVPEAVCVGYAGELHPRVVAAFRLAPRTCAVELNLSVIESAATRLAPVQAPVISTFPVASQDVALVVEGGIPAADVSDALVAGAASAGNGALLEDAVLFDVYTGGQVGPGRKSLAYHMRFRAADRTLTDDEVGVARDAAVAEAARRTGAVLRGA